LIGDEISDRLLTFGVRSGTHTMSRAIGFGVRAILNKLRENEASRAGEMPLEKLSQGQQAAIQGVEVSPQRISEFDHFAKKYGLQYSVIQEENDPTKLFITFRQKDIEKLDMAVTDMMKDRTREWNDLGDALEQARERAFSVQRVQQQSGRAVREVMRDR
jgi:phosphoribosylformylglycinamidine (FGAM) synthase-like enzyme